MSACDAVGMLVSYRILTNMSNDHFVNTTTRGLLHSVCVIHDNSGWEMVSEKIFPVSFCCCGLCATTYTVWSNFVQSTYDKFIFSRNYM